jgi:hypothetical protein
MRRVPFVAATVGLALVIAVLIGWLSNAAGYAIKWYLTLPTALLVSLFVALIMIGGQAQPARVKGFEVVSKQSVDEPGSVTQDWGEDSDDYGDERSGEDSVPTDFDSDRIDDFDDDSERRV